MCKEKERQVTTKGSFELDCRECRQPVTFSLFDLADVKLVSCTHCGKKYGLGEENLTRQLKKFAALCRHIQESEEILGTAGVAVTVGKDEIKIPFKILLTRLKSTLDLQVGQERLAISFRVEPTAL